jgi:hypothetical protein
MIDIVVMIDTGDDEVEAVDGMMRSKHHQEFISQNE